MRCVPFTAALILAAATASCARHRVEQPAYDAAKMGGGFEIREYPDLVVARTAMGEDGRANAPFMRLFRYIDGGNEAGRKIAMTSPVLMDQTEDGDRRMGFIVPAAVAGAGAPGPDSEAVAIETLAGGTFAVQRFAGLRTAANERRGLERLHARIEDEGLTPVGSPLFAYYDPPWTPVPMRRNEVLQRVER